MAIGEFALIQKYFANMGKHPSVTVGVGDDAAILQPSKGHQLVTAVDTLVADVHFPANADPFLIAKRSLRVNLSDFAAMGAIPKWFTLAITLPNADESWLQRFAKGLAEDAQLFNCALVGGDTTKGPLTLSIAMMGEVLPYQALLRKTAQVGDSVYVTGPLGGAAAALGLLDKTPTQPWHKPLLDAYYLPQPRLAESQKLMGLAHAGIDISDGLLADCGHVAKQSCVAIQLDYASIPKAEALLNNFSANQQQDFVLHGGDDYELVFTAPKDAELQLQAIGLPIFKIGEVGKGEGVVCLDAQGQVINVEHSGYQHFS